MKKTNMDENVHTFRARMVMKGYNQTQETFSPIPKIKSIRILLVISVYYDYEI